MYEAHLRSLLSPLGIYDLEEHSASGAAVCALGTGLDTVSRRLEEIEREALTATAEGEGLARREALFARRPAAVTAEDRRAAIAALLQIDGDSLTPAAIDRTIRGCGIRARALEMGGGQLRVIFPEVAGEPEDFDQNPKDHSGHPALSPGSGVLLPLSHLGGVRGRRVHLGPGGGGGIHLGEFPAGGTAGAIAQRKKAAALTGGGLSLRRKRLGGLLSENHIKAEKDKWFCGADNIFLHFADCKFWDFPVYCIYRDAYRVWRQAYPVT